MYRKSFPGAALALCAVSPESARADVPFNIDELYGSPMGGASIVPHNVYQNGHQEIATCGDTPSKGAQL